MMATGLYSITVGQGAVVNDKGWGWKPKNKIHQVAVAQLCNAEPLATEVIQQEQGLKLLHASVGGPNTELVGLDTLEHACCGSDICLD